MNTIGIVHHWFQMKVIYTSSQQIFMDYRYRHHSDKTLRELFRLDRSSMDPCRSSLNISRLASAYGAFVMFKNSIITTNI
uniref:Uncharacterized protein n=1 Tax=Physcomitrium patens TaxID=3218 RepID=A0A2K1K609_PHYPA|nr:hypothetical protein PHYPA_011117 [Physcomitrium patens]